MATVMNAITKETITGKDRGRSMEFKTMPLLNAEVGEDRVVKSIFSVFGNVDDGGDRIWPGAFTQTIKQRADRIKVLWQHDSFSPPIGVPISIEEIGRSDLPEKVKDESPDASGGLLASVKYLDTPRGNEVLVGIRDGAITECSIGYDPVKFDWESVEGSKWDMIRNLKEVRLWDLSPVSWGMNSLTTNVKCSADPRLASLLTTVNMLLAPDALKAGRVLSSRNLERLQSALAVLQEILSSAEPPESDEDAKALTAVRAALLSRLAIAERELALIGG